MMKLNLFRNGLLCLLMVGVTTLSFSQQRELDTLNQKFDVYRKNTLQEKLYAHIDRTFYLTGETLWFKVYSVDGSLHKPLDLSKIVYLEVLDKNNFPAVQTKIAMKNGFGSGSVFLSASLNTGNYTVRLYTNWMKNFSPEFYYHQSITIVNPFTKPDPEKQNLLNSANIEFFPEGGNLVQGLKSKVAFKISVAKDYNRVSGAILNESNDTIVNFRPLKFGLGNFYFTPLPAHEYHAVLRDTNGKVTIHKLPSIQETGYVISVSDSASLLKVHVTNQLNALPEIPVVYLFVHARNIVTKSEAKFYQQKGFDFTIDKKLLPEGISHITLFNHNLQPVCERLYFKSPTQKLSVQLNTDQQLYGNRRKIKINLQTSTASANVSLAVYKRDSLTTFQSNNIFEYFWLSSDLRGFIESPEYYFTNDPLVKEAADNLMLTHGWRRFNWKDVLSKNIKLPHEPEYRGHIIHAKVTENNGGTSAGILTYLSSPDKVIRFYGSRSDARGEVKFEMRNFLGSHQLVAQTNTEKDSTYKIEIARPFSTNFSSYAIPPLKLSSAVADELLKRSIAMQVQDIYNQEASNKFKNVNIDSVAFYGTADETYYLDKYTRFQVMEEVLREYVPGVLLRKKRDGFHFIVLDNINKGVLPDNPMILLDGVPVFDTDKIMTFNPLLVKKLEVLNRKYYLGPLIIPGIVSFSTYQGDLAGFTLDSKSVSLNYEGLQLQREFYNPQYENQKQRSEPVPDQRDLLYWSPTIITDSQGRSQVEFYSSDLSGEYIIKVEGINKDGFSGSAVQKISIKGTDY
jgi:hypothetical protein